MIESLSLKNFVLFEEQKINFTKHTNGLVGQTGSGKSVIFSAISVLCGQRNIKRLIMKNKDFYELEMVLTVDDLKEKSLKTINSILNTNLQANDKLKIYRKLDQNSKSIIKVNDKTITINELKDLMSHFIDIHSQQYTELVLKEENHIKIIDKLIDNNLLNEYKEKFKQYKNKSEEVKKLNKINDNKEENLELINFKLNQFKNFEQIESEDYLAVQKNKLEQKEKAKKADDVIENNFKNILNLLNEIKGNAEYIEAENFEDNLNNVYYEIENLSFEHAKSISNIEDYNLDEINEKLNILKSLKRKYNLDYEGLKNKLEQLKEQKEKINNISFEIVKSEKELNVLKSEIEQLASNISNKRKQIALAIEDEINKHFIDLDMINSKMKIDVQQIELGELGKDEINFFIKTNKGHDFELINEIASGGEKSRIMLIIKMTLNKFDYKPTYLLDEIDQGISSLVAKKMADKLKDFSQSSQLLIISHTVQVINSLDDLFEVEKVDENNMTISVVNKLDSNNRDDFIKQYLEI